jgi:hypothetical protein
MGLRAVGAGLPYTATGKVVIAAPNNDTALVVNGAVTNLIAQFVSGNSGGSGQADVQIARNGSTINTRGAGPSLIFNDSNTGFASILQHSGGQTEQWQYNGIAWNLNWKVTTTNAMVIIGALACNGVAPPAQVTGFGVPTGVGVINNFPGATATLAQCSQAIAQIIKDLKAFGLYGA